MTETKTETKQIRLTLKSKSFLDEVTALLNGYGFCFSAEEEVTVTGILTHNLEKIVESRDTYQEGFEFLRSLGLVHKVTKEPPDNFMLRKIIGEARSLNGKHRH